MYLLSRQGSTGCVRITPQPERQNVRPETKVRPGHLGQEEAARGPQNNYFFLGVLAHLSSFPFFFTALNHVLAADAHAHLTSLEELLSEPGSDVK